MEGQKDVARVSWGNAQKIRTSILSNTPSLAKDRGNTNYITRFEETEQTMAEFRLACMKTIFHDFEYAVGKKVEHSLWQCHTFLNGEYRKALGRLNLPSQVVQRRKLDKLYRGFLKTSEQFYFFYIQKLHGRFSIPELNQVARKEKSQPMEQQSEEVNAPAALRALVLKSCQTTLVRLGDLARYRCQLSEKFSKNTFDTALDYYGLASVLDPDDGSAHHQLAVLHQIPGQHFDIVYHFHRAIAISRPHELALKNLEREFKSPESPSYAKKGPSKDPSQAMLTWFVRLHAFFFHGKNFSQQSELEEEVLHRFELALKSDDHDEKLLLKIILVNIAAYDISTEKVKSAWTMEGSQSCQFLLRFNSRMMLILLRALQHVLHEDAVFTIASNPEPSGGESRISFAPSLSKLLPLFRLYLAWSYVARADLVQYQEYLEPHIKDLYRLLADVLTSLNAFVEPSMETVSSKYLLPEDTEAQGLRPLSDRRLPLFLYKEEQRGSVSSKRSKTRKPQQSVFGRRFKQETEIVWRIRDILCCGVFLAGSAKFPIALTTQHDGDHGVDLWVFVDGTPASPCPNETRLSLLLTKLGFGESKPTVEDPVVQETQKPDTQMAKDIPAPSLEDKPEVSVSLHVSKKSLSKDEGKGKEPVKPVKPSTHYQYSDLSEDSEMINMVNKLLDPSDDVRPQSSHTQADPSYGMHSSTANEIFGNIDVSPIQPSPVSKAIPSLPWDYFYKPTPHRSNSRGQDLPSSIGLSVPRSATGQSGGYASSSYLNDLGATYYQAQPSSLSPRLNMGYPRNSPIPNTSSPSLRGDYGLDTLESSRNAVLDSLKLALFAQHGLSRDTPSPGIAPQNRSNMTPVWGHRNGMAEYPYAQTGSSVQSPELRYSDMFGFSGSPAARQANVVNPQSPLCPPGQSRQDLGRASLTNDSHITTALKPTSSNSSDAHQIWGQGSSGYRQQHSSWQSDLPGGTSPLQFSHPSSLITGTPGAVPTGSANTVPCNGNYYNATTAFGRSGDGVNNRADPTHFRNQLKAAIGTSDIPYDQQILQSAMMDSNRKQRPK